MMLTNRDVHLHPTVQASMSEHGPAHPGIATQICAIVDQLFNKQEVFKSATPTLVSRSQAHSWPQSLLLLHTLGH